MAPPLLVFDLDGTLVDTAPDLLTTLEAVLPRHGFEVEIDLSFRNGIGHGARHLIECALHRQRSAVDTIMLDSIHRDFIDHYEANICVSSRLFPGCAELLDRFAAAGWQFAVCTNKLERLSRLLLAELEIEGRFAAISGGDTFASRKPDPAHLMETIAAAAGAPENAVMVGDTRVDLDTARSAGIPFVGVTFGYTPVPMAELEPDVLIDSFERLAPDIAAGLIAANGTPRFLRPRPLAVT
jgi:phosphoglycolate phosphatase